MGHFFVYENSIDELMMLLKSLTVKREVIEYCIRQLLI